MSRQLLALLLWGWAAVCVADDHAVALIYHHVDRGSPASTSVTPETFELHLDYLADENYEVWPLGRVLAQLRAGRPLPPNTVSITFDDAYSSVYTEAYPRLRRRGWTATLFVNSEAIDRGYRGSMTWEQLRKLAEAGFEIGNHSHSHAHLVRRLDGESAADWRQRVTADIERARQRLQTETGVETSLFAYPYGEYSTELKQVVEALGYTGIAQQSGAIGAGSDFLALPRYPMSTGYADLERFATSLRSRPLPVIEVRMQLANEPDSRLASLQFDLGEGEFRAAQLACYSASGERLSLKSLGEDSSRYRIVPSSRQRPGRNKINCTAPARAERGVYFWYSFQWLVKNPDGSWYRE